MKESYIKYSEIFKALADPNRLMIVDMLSTSELCACMILAKFNITQPTLSHHMKILCDCGLVKGRKQGKWTYYSIREETQKKTISFLRKLAVGRINETALREMECYNE